MSSYEKTLDVIFGRRKSQILYAGVKLGVFDNVTTGPKGASTNLVLTNIPKTFLFFIFMGKKVCLKPLNSLGEQNLSTRCLSYDV